MVSRLQYFSIPQAADLSSRSRTATEQSRRLERAESRTVIENLQAETASLQPDGREPQDAASIRSIDVSVNFDVDSILLKHRTYKKVYSNVRINLKATCATC